MSGCARSILKLMTPLLAVGPAPLALEPIVAAVTESRGEGRGMDGAVAVFLGTVRNHNAGRSVSYLVYEAYEPLALRSFERIVRVESRFRSKYLFGRMILSEKSATFRDHAPSANGRA